MKVLALLSLSNDSINLCTLFPIALATRKFRPRLNVYHESIQELLYI